MTNTAILFRKQRRIYKRVKKAFAPIWDTSDILRVMMNNPYPEINWIEFEKRLKK